MGWPSFDNPRFSRAIAAIACKIFKLVVVEFFDDFTQLEPLRSAESAQAAMEGLLQILGWKVATAEAKRQPFADQFVSLGVLVDLAEAKRGRIILSHKPGRIASFEKQVKEILSRGVMDFKAALSIRGKVYFSEGHVYGRVAAPVVHMLSRWEQEVGSLI